LWLLCVVWSAPSFLTPRKYLFSRYILSELGEQFLGYVFAD
jgi:hypothetical protein